MPGKLCKNPFLLWWTPLILLGLITPFTLWLDLTISQNFFKDAFQGNAFFDFLYIWGILPGWIMVGGALAVLISSYQMPEWKVYRRAAAILVLSLAIGSGLIVHLIFKDNWGRPRPKQTIEFGGHQAFRPYYEPNIFHQPEPSKSFPCGHCTMGFYFFALALIGRCERSRKLYMTGMIMAWGLGLLLGLARIAQGGHYFSDVLVSALIMWYTPLVLTTLLYREPKQS